MNPWSEGLFSKDALSVGQVKALRRLASLETYPPEKQNHVTYDAVKSPLQFATIPDIRFNCVSESTEVDPADVLSPQRYVYRSKLKWYVEHPSQIETPQLRLGKYWWLASVFRFEGKHVVGNGNHRVVTAMLLGWTSMKVRLLEPV